MGSCNTSEKDTFEEDTRLWVANRVDLRQTKQTSENMTDAERNLDLDALKEAWRKEGFHDHLLRKYTWYRMIKQAPSRQRDVDLIVGQLFDEPWEKRHWDHTTDGVHDLDLRIHYLS
ncbi:hypothetical protein ACJQWK_02931 [Exserohilum turcicum]